MRSYNRAVIKKFKINNHYTGINKIITNIEFKKFRTKWKTGSSKTEIKLEIKFQIWKLKKKNNEILVFVWVDNGPR